ncbi:aKG-HExxH-type peptide beta-hydroxylase [Phormidium tenue]|nr:HEXXH motif-containing putative peptide modification protein [Phormidium tenue]MBD2233662.1 hypothetical protein [Phormidium tenue FACHB-1052]
MTEYSVPTKEANKHASILDMLMVLQWQNKHDTLAAIHERWLAFVYACLELRLASVATKTPALATALTEQLSSLSEPVIESILLAPECTFRLLPRRPATENDAAEYLRKAILVERIRAGNMMPVEEELCSARGDFVVYINGQCVQTPRVAGLWLDVGSRQSRYLDISGQRFEIDEAREPFAVEELELVLERVRKACVGISAVSPYMLSFVTLFTKVLILQPDPKEPFSSGSNGYFVGRSVISNPHIPTVDEADIADAIVHEAIHSLLYMQEDLEPWVMDEEMYDPTPRIRSPWTGNPLPIRPFLQACFVWYGLTHFWSQAFEVFPERRVRSLLARSSTGFVGPKLIGEIGEWEKRVDPSVRQVIDAMQDQIKTALMEIL